MPFRGVSKSSCGLKQLLGEKLGFCPSFAKEKFEAYPIVVFKRNLLLVNRGYLP